MQKNDPVEQKDKGFFKQYKKEFSFKKKKKKSTIISRDSVKQNRSKCEYEFSCIFLINIFPCMNCESLRDNVFRG